MPVKSQSAKVLEMLTLSPIRSAREKKTVSAAIVRERGGRQIEKKVQKRPSL